MEKLFDVMMQSSVLSAAMQKQGKIEYNRKKHNKVYDTIRQNIGKMSSSEIEDMIIDFEESILKDDEEFIQFMRDELAKQKQISIIDSPFNKSEL